MSAFDWFEKAAGSAFMGSVMLFCVALLLMIIGCILDVCGY